MSRTHAPQLKTDLLDETCSTFDSLGPSGPVSHRANISTTGKILAIVGLWTVLSVWVATIGCTMDAPTSPRRTPTSVVAPFPTPTVQMQPTATVVQTITDTSPPATSTAIPTVSPTPNPVPAKTRPSPEAAQSADADTEPPYSPIREDRAILLLDVAATNREESLVTVGLRTDGHNLGTVAPAPGAVWSHEGMRFAYITGDGVSVKIGNLDGEEFSVLDTGTEWHPMYQWPAWSPDGKLLAAINVAWCEVGMKVSSVEIIDALNGGSVDRHGPYDFWQADGTLQGPRRLSTPNNISWSSDGDKLLVSWDKAVVINVRTGKPRVVSSEPVLAEWAPTGDALYYFKIEVGDQNKRNRTLGAFNVRRIEADEPEILLTADEVSDMGLAAEWGAIPGVMSLSPSGTMLAVSGGGDENGNSDLHLFSIPDGSIAVSADDAVHYPVKGRLVALDWAPDGNRLVGLVADASGVRMDVFDLATSEWNAVANLGIEVNQVQFLGKTISWSR